MKVHIWNSKTTKLAVVILFLIAIPISLVLAANTGPIDAGVGENINNGQSTPWTDPGNITASDGIYAQAPIPEWLTDQNYSQILQASQYNFNIPFGSTIDGITVEILRYSSGNLSSTKLIQDHVVSLVKGGTIVGDNKARTSVKWPTATYTGTLTATYGGPSDLWGTTWTPEEINAAGFGVALVVTNPATSNTRTAFVDSVKITVEYTPPDSTTSIACTPSTVTYGSSITCTATVSTLGAEGTPTGTVSWVSDVGGTFEPGACPLSGTGGTATCSSSFTPTVVGAGSHIITGTYNGDTNFSPSMDTQAVTVNKLPIEVSAEAKSKVYGFADPALTYQVTAGSLVLGDTFSGSLSRVAGEDVGVYTIQKGTLTLSDNYDMTFFGSQLTITERPITVAADAQSKVYGDADPSLTYQVTSGSLADGDSFQGSLTRIAGESAGTYAIEIGSLALSTNYNLSYIGSDLTISQKPITVTANTQTKVYGNADPTLTYTITSGGLAFTDSFTGSLIRDAGEVVGSYTIRKGSLSLSTDYLLSFVESSLSITKRAIEVTADNVFKTYGEIIDPPLTYTVTSGALAFTDTFTGGLIRAAGEFAGSYAILQGSLSLSSNYDLTYVGANLTINQRPITVTAHAKTKMYGEADPELTYSITAGSLAFGENFTGQLGRPAGEDAGQYEIQQNTLALTNNYQLTYVKASLTISPRPMTVTAFAKTKVFGEDDPALTYQITSGILVGTDAFTGSLIRATGENVGVYAIQQGTLALSANYSLAFVEADFTITKRPMTITAEPKSKIYGEADPAFTYQLTSGSLVGNDHFTGVLGRAAGEDVGAYAIQLGSLVISDNYNLSLVSANLTISKRTVVVKALAASKTYGEADPTFSYLLFSGTLITGDSFHGALSRAEGENVGAYAILTGTLAISDNYDLVLISANLTINQRPITISADAVSKVYGDADPTFSYQITAGSLAVTDAISGALSRTAGENVGNYTIQQGSLAISNNYALTFVGADLTITRRLITVTANAKTKAWGDPDPSLNYQVTSGSLAFTDDFTGALSREPGEEIGSYAILQNTLALSDNYTLTYNGANLTISKATPILTITNSPVLYNGSPREVVVTSSVAGTVSNVLYGVSPTAPTNAGIYAITADFTPTDAAHYNSLTSASVGNFVIDKVTPVLSITNSPVNYNGSPQAANVTGSVPGTATNIKYNGSSTVPSAPGSYAVVADFTPTDAVNYNSLVGASAGNFIINGSGPALLLGKTALPVTYAKVGDVINYSYELTNAGDVVLQGPFTVDDDKTTVTCPDTASLNPSGTVTCTASYSVTLNDVIMGSVTNTATASGFYADLTVTSNTVQVIVRTFRLFLPLIVK